MKLIDAVNAQPSLKTLSETSLPVKAAYRVAKALKTIAGDIMEYEQQRAKLLMKYGKINEAGTEYSFETPEIRASFDTSLQVLQDEPIAIGVDPLEIEDLGDCNLTPGTLFPLIGVLLKE